MPKISHENPNFHIAELPLQNLLKFVENDLRTVNDVILKHLHSPVALIPQLASHLIASGGKRIRPLLTLASALLCGYEGEHHITLAASIEFIHSATLLHDDVVDESSLRRGTVCANAVWGNQASVLVGDFLFSRAFQLMVSVNSFEILTLLSNASAAIAEGEVLQLLTTQDLSTTEETYLEVVLSKTAKLFEAATEIGAILTQKPPHEQKMLATFGRSLGIAFQLADDALDYSVKKMNMGKNVGDDFKEGKMTLPVVWALKNASEKERIFWQRTIGELNQNESDFNQALSYLIKHNAIEMTLIRAQHYAQHAHEQLQIFPPSPIRSALEEICTFVLERTR